MKVPGNVAGKRGLCLCWHRELVGSSRHIWITVNSRGLTPAYLHIQGRWIWIWSNLTDQRRGVKKQLVGRRVRLQFWRWEQLCICHLSAASTNLHQDVICLDRWSPPSSTPTPAPPPAPSVWLTSPVAAHKIKNTSLVGRTCVFSPPPPPLGFKGERGGWADVRTGRDGRFYKSYGKAERDGHFYHRNILLRATQPALATERERETERRMRRNGFSW